MAVGGAGVERADVGWGGGDNLGLSARQNFQPWRCWAFPRGYPPWARQLCTWTDPGHQGSQRDLPGQCQLPLGPEETAQGARVCPGPTPSPQPSVSGWVTEPAGNPTPAKPRAET